MNSDYLEEFYTFLKTQKRYSLHTINSYKNDLSLFFDYMKVENIIEINQLTIQSYFSNLYVNQKAYLK